MNPTTLRAASVAVAALCITSVASADVVKENTEKEKASAASSPELPSGRFEFSSAASSMARPLAPGTFEITSDDAGLIGVRSNAVPIATLLRAIAKKANLKIMISDDVEKIKGSLLGTLTIRKVPVDNLMESLAKVNNLAIGKVGLDTYLIVKAPPQTHVVLRSQPQMTIPGMRTLPQDVNPRWQPFQFNGDTIYRIPLQSGKEAEKATATTVK